MEPYVNSTFVAPSEQEVPLKIVFIRHGEADTSASKTRGDPPLTDLGTRQAERAARRLADMTISHFYCSTLQRAESTANLIHVYHRNIKLDKTDDLREVSHLHFLPDLVPDDPTVKENLRQEKDCVTRFINHIRHTHNPGETICVVCHGNIIRTMMPMFGGRDPGRSLLIEINNASVTILDTWLTGDSVLILSNCVKHLLERQIT